MQKVLITAALPYVNNVPHLGNLVGSTLSADVYARYSRLIGKDVLFLCGTDEYGSTTTVKAKQEKVSCQELCDRYHLLHKEIYNWFGISFDIFGRTTTDTQTSITQDIFMQLYKNGYIEGKESEQMYCDNCELFLADRHIQGLCYHPICVEHKVTTNGDQCEKCNNIIDVSKLIEPICCECKQTPHMRKTKHLFFRLDQFQHSLTKHFIIDQKTFLTDNAYITTKTLLEKGLESRCITRDLKWGTPMPADVPGLEEYKYFMSGLMHQSDISLF